MVILLIVFSPGWFWLIWWFVEYGILGKSLYSWKSDLFGESGDCGKSVQYGESGDCAYPGYSLRYSDSGE